MEETKSPQPTRGRVSVGVLALVVLLLLPLIALALLDIMRGGEDVVLEWSVVWIGLVAIGAAQVAMLVRLWRRDRGRGADRPPGH